MSDPALDALYAKADGNPWTTTVDLRELLMLQRDAARGDANCRYVAGVALAMVLRVNNAPDSRPTRCGCCSGTIRPGERYVICVALGGAAELTADAGCALCDTCGVTPVTLAAAMRVPGEAVPPDRTRGGGQA
jgi:hypothetical protein